MVKDAEAHAAEDRKFHELVNVRNQADNLVHATRKTLKDLGEKVASQERGEIESAIKDVEDALKSDDKARIEVKTQRLADVSGKLAERVYREQGGAGGAGGAGPQGGPEPDSAQKRQAGGDDVVDAEFEEVRDDKK